MSPKDVIRLFRTRAWQQTCLAGAPVPDEHVCAALHCTSQALTELKVGDTARITCLDAAHSSIATKLAAMGILPGTRIRLIRRRPVYVFRIDYAEFAVDGDLASLIKVQPCA